MSEPQTKKTKVSALDQLKAITTIVADTGDFEGMYVLQFDYFSVASGRRLLRCNIPCHAECALETNKSH